MDSDQQTARLSGVAVFLCVFLPFALGHFLSGLLRNVNAVLAPELVGSLALTSSELGLLTSAFFFSFALVQLPVGIALDRHGPRRVQFVLLLLAAAGLVLFARGRDFAELVIARAVIGLGVGGCFMSAVKALATWVAPGRLPSVNGYLIAVGGLGAASGTLPVRMALEHTDWRGLFMLLAVATACAALLIGLVTPRATPTGDTTAPSLRSLLLVYRDPVFRETASLMLIPHTIFFGIQGLWIGRWLSDVGRCSDDEVAYLLYLSMAAVIVGAIGVGVLTEWAGRRGVKPLAVGGIGVAAFVAVQAAIVCGHAPSFQLLAVAFTLIGSITGIEYTIVAQSMPRELTGRGSTCLNLLIFAGAFLMQAAFGQILDFWRPDALNHYPAIAYRAAFGVLVLLQLPGLVLHFVRRRSVPRRYHLPPR